MRRLGTEAEILAVLGRFDRAFPRAITSRVADLGRHAKQLAEWALVYVAEREGAEAGFVAFYANDGVSGTAFLTHIAVDERFQGAGVGRELMRVCMEGAREAGMRRLKLEVDTANQRAIGFYEGLGFERCGEASGESVYMVRELGEGFPAELHAEAGEADGEGDAQGAGG